MLVYKNKPRGAWVYGATIGIRTRDLFLTMEALYQLSYRGLITDTILPESDPFCKRNPHSQASGGNGHEAHESTTTASGASLLKRLIARSMSSAKG